MLKLIHSQRSPILKISSLLLLCFTAGLLSSASIAQAQGSRIDADIVFHNGDIWTGNSQQSRASTLAIKNQRLVYVGNAAPNIFNANQIFDFNKAFVAPGFQDNHVHFFEGGFALASIQLREVNSRQKFVTAFKEFIPTRKTGQWILNGNWDHERWGGELPNKSWIDDFSEDNPVFVIRLDGHMALANSKALELAGIDKSSTAPAGGEIIRDKQGKPTGVLKGNAMALVQAIIPAPTEEEILESFEVAQDHALRLGLTKVHAVTAYPNETWMLEYFELANKRGLQKLRARVSLPIESRESVAALVAEQGRGDDLLSWGGVKGFIDGSLGSRTAWFYQAYEDDSSTTGNPLNDTKDIQDWMQYAHENELGMAIHAIGDRGVDLALSSIESIAKAAAARYRYRIEHFQHPSDQAMQKAAELGVILSMHPYHAIDDGRWAAERLGERVRSSYAFRSILDAGGILTFGSDWPVAPLSPIQGMYAATTRRTTDGKNPEGWLPSEKISIEEALTAYTANNAFANFDEANLGSLEIGKYADFVVLSDSLIELAAEQLLIVEVEATVIGGEIVYQAKRGGRQFFDQ